MRSARLGELCDIQAGGTPSRSRSDFFGGPIPWAKISDIEASDGLIRHTEETISKAGLDAIRGRLFPPGTLLFAIYGSIGKMAFTERHISANQAILGIQIRHSDQLDDRFLYHWLRSLQPKLLADGQGIAQKNLSAAYVRDMGIPLPPLDEQQRIAAILDQVDALRRKRREAIARLNQLIEAILKELILCGTESCAERWPKLKFVSLLSEPLRSGVSPSTNGTFQAPVLTLSAITGENFNGESKKLGTFKAEPQITHRVSSDDFLICRGNGSADLVGRGAFPTKDMPDTIFPDTIIAGRIDHNVIDRLFLQYVWNAPENRREIVRISRTTNGTFKVNQTMLESIDILTPPIERQREFGRKATAIVEQRVVAETQLAHLDTLFASLQHRAFGGEL